MQWYLGVFKKYATFSGRARRKEYWMFYLFNAIIGFGLSFTDGLLGLASDSGYGPLYSIYLLVILIPALAVGVRRIHDSDHSGWWMLVPFVSLYFLIIEGTRGDNRFGPDPKAGEMPVAPYPAYAPAPPVPGFAPAAPVVEQAPVPVGVPSGWHPDPTGRHQFRYWDGATWTDSVSDDGATATDPV